MKLYLIRHGLAETHGMKPDADRALTPAGREKMERAAKGLRKTKIKLQLILTSPLKRARETAEIVAGGLYGVKVETMPELAPGSEPSATISAIGAYRDRKEIALVGHQPHIGQLASLLLTGSPDLCEMDFKKGSVACIDAEFAGEQAKCSLNWLLTPKLMRSL
jgi:phosphohistidine phosphatase